MTRGYASYHLRTWQRGPSGVAVRVEDVRTGERWELPPSRAAMIVELLRVDETRVDATEAAGPAVAREVVEDSA